MRTFPLLSTNAVAQYPSGSDVQTSTSTVTYIDGTIQAFRNYRRPARRWILRMDQMTQPELVQLEDFWRVHATTEPFTFVDPWDGTEHPNCTFENEWFEALNDGPGRWRSGVVIRN